MWLSFSCILEFPLFPPSLHNTCSCYYLHSQIDADKDSVFWLVNLHLSSIQVEGKIGCISIPSKSVQVFWFKFLVWYTRSKNLNSRNLNGDLDAKLVSCIPGLKGLKKKCVFLPDGSESCSRHEYSWLKFFSCDVKQQSDNQEASLRVQLSILFFLTRLNFSKGTVPCYFLYHRLISILNSFQYSLYVRTYFPQLIELSCFHSCFINFFFAFGGMHFVVFH